VLIASLVVLLVGIGAFGGAALGDGRVPVVDADVPFIDAAETTETGEAASEESEAGTGTTATGETTPTGTTTTTTTEPAGPFTLTVEKLGRGGPKGTVVSDPGGIDCGGVCTSEFDDGDEVTLIAEPPARFEVRAWSEAGCGQESACTVTMDDDRTVTVTFEPKLRTPPPTTDPPPTVPPETPPPPPATVPEQTIPTEPGPIF
jgi:hypothetical protein